MKQTTNLKRFWQLTNILSVVFALGLNFLTGAQLIGLPAINEISDKYATLLTPAGYAFSIWSLVYLLLIVFVVYQARDILKPTKDNDLPLKMGPFFAIANICNGIWTYIFVQELVALSVVVLLILTTSLFILLYRLKIAVYDAPLKTIAFTWWPLLIYTGWVTVATVVNIASWFEYIGVAITPLVAIIFLIVLAVALILLLAKRNVRELLLASAWGIAAIGVEQLGANQPVMLTAFGVSAVLLVAFMVHGYLNRDTNPFRHLFS